MIIREIIKFLIFLIPINPFEEVIEVLSNCSRISFVHVTMFASKRGRRRSPWSSRKMNLSNAKKLEGFLIGNGAIWLVKRKKDNFEVLIRNTWSQKWFYFTIFTESARLNLKKCLIAPYGQFFHFFHKKIFISLLVFNI